MYHRILALALLASATSGALAADGTFDRTLAVPAGTNVSVATGSGYLHLFAGNDTQIHIVGHVHVHTGWFGNDADARVRTIVATPPIVQSGNTVTVGVTHGDSSLQNISIDYDVTLPRTATLKAHTGSGDIQIGGIDGPVTADSGSGDLKVENIGANAHLQTGSGSIHAANVHGAASLQTGSGDVQLSLSGPGDIHAQTGSGAIRVDGLNGGLRAGAASGEIEVSGNPTSEWRLESGSGSIRLKLPSSARFNLNAETGSGTIHVDQPMVMQGSLNKHHVSGSVNGGGPTVRATTGSGDIVIR